MRKLLGIIAALAAVVAVMAATAVPASANTAIEYGLMASVGSTVGLCWV